MPPHRKPEEISDQDLAQFLTTVPEDLYVFNTGGRYSAQEGSARSIALRQITEVKVPVPLREVIRRAARLDGIMGIDPATTRQGVELHQQAIPCVYWLLRKAEDGSLHAVTAIRSPDGYESVAAGSPVLDSNGGIQMRQISQQALATQRGMSPVMREHYEVGSSFGVTQFSAAEFNQRYRSLYPDRNPGSILPADYTPQPRNAGRPQFLEKTEDGTYKFTDLVSHDWTTANKIDPDDLEKLKARFLAHYADFSQLTFAASSGGYWDEERSYKQDLINAAQQALQELVARPAEELGYRLLEILNSQRSNLLGWRMKQRIAKVRAENPGAVERSTGTMARSDSHPETAIAQFVQEIWPLFAKGNEASLPYADLRALPTMLLALAKPEDAIGVRYQLFHNAGMILLNRSLFANQPLTENEYATVLDMARQLFAIMTDEWHWSPRDLWDVQGFIWVTCNEKLDVEDLEVTYGALSPSSALQYLSKRFTVVREPVQYMAGFKTSAGRPLALDRQATYVSLFLEQGDWTKSGAEIVKQYERDENRHSNLLSHAPTLANGHLAVKMRVNSWNALAALCDDYEGDEALALRRAPPIAEDANHKEVKSMALPTNLILYGPPGTGKTFATAAESIRLCGFNPDEMTRGEVMSVYKDLVSRRRIEFVTFHQSYSYEDFVEGLRPDTGSQDTAEQPKTGGFQLIDRPGVFRALAERAQASKGLRAEGPIDLADRQAFKMSLGRSGDDEQAYLFEEALKGGYVLLGYGGDIDWSDPKYDSFEEIRARWLQIDPSAKGNDPNIQQTFALRSWMREGDLVIVSDGNKRFRAVGMVTGPYRRVPRERDEYYHQRPVKWLWSDDNGLPREDIYDRGFSQVSIYNLDQSAVKWPALAEIVSGGQVHGANTQEPFVLIIDEINRANVSKVFGELITLIEADKRQGQPNELSVTLPYSGKTFAVPSNLHIIGTMNTADRSIALLDTALRRRFRFKELLPDPDQLPEEIFGISLRKALRGMNSRIEYLYDRDHQIGHAYFMGCNSREDIDEVMRHKIIPLLVEYFYEDWEKVRAVLNEGSDEGMFISRTLLKAPTALTASNGEFERWRYSVNGQFSMEAYAQLAE